MGKKWESCVKKVSKSQKRYNPYAVCTKSVGRMNAKGSKESQFIGKGGKSLVSVFGLFANPMKGEAQDLFMGTIYKKKR